MSKAIVLLSGGLDSTLCLTKAVHELGTENVSALSLFYGQKHKVELTCASAIASFFGVRHSIVQLPSIFHGAGSALMSEIDMPHLTYEELGKCEGPSPTYVPFRNANLLSAATTLALAQGANLIYYGAHAEDARNWAYPDCTPEFNGAMANAIYIGSYYKVRLITPLQWHTKTQIVKESMDLGSPVHLTYSCYEGQEIACGVCPTCVGRLEAFRQAGYIDLIPYRGGVR